MNSILLTVIRPACLVALGKFRIRSKSFDARRHAFVFRLHGDAHFAASFQILRLASYAIAHELGIPSQGVGTTLPSGIGHHQMIASHADELAIDGDRRKLQLLIGGVGAWLCRIGILY